MGVWMRKGVDNKIYESLVNEWKSHPKYKLRTFDPLLPSTEPTSTDLYRFGTFTRSDHASFWYHKHPSKKSLNAILITDMGKEMHFKEDNFVISFKTHSFFYIFVLSTYSSLNP